MEKRGQGKGSKDIHPGRTGWPLHREKTDFIHRKMEVYEGKEGKSVLG